MIAGSKYYGREGVIWSVGCIFCELITKAATLRADFEAQQLELIIQLCGRPTGELLDYYKALPDWEKINISKVFPGRLRTRFATLKIRPGWT